MPSSMAGQELARAAAVGNLAPAHCEVIEIRADWRPCRSAPSSVSTATPAATRCAWWRAAHSAGGRLDERAPQDFRTRYDWIRTALMFEPRGHDVMSGAILYPPCRADCDVGVLYIEVSGCLPMCGHGTIGTVTFALEQAWCARVRRAGCASTPRGPRGRRLRAQGPLRRACAPDERRELSGAPRGARRLPGSRRARGGCCVRRQLLRHRRAAAELRRPRRPVRRRHSPVQPDPAGAGERGRRSRPSRRSDHTRRLAPSWTAPARPQGARAQRRVLWREGDRPQLLRHRHPARMAQLAARGRLAIGEAFVHESIIGSLFEGRVERAAAVGEHAAIVPSVAGWAR